MKIEYLPGVLYIFEPTLNLKFCGSFPLQWFLQFLRRTKELLQPDCGFAHYGITQCPKQQESFKEEAGTLEQLSTEAEYDS